MQLFAFSGPFGPTPISIRAISKGFYKILQCCVFANVCKQVVFTNCLQTEAVFTNVVFGVCKHCLQTRKVTVYKQCLQTHLSVFTNSTSVYKQFTNSGCVYKQVFAPSM